VSWYQKGKTNLDFTEARDSDEQWNQLGHMQVCTSLQTDNHASIPPLCFFTGRMPFLPPNQQCQSTEGMSSKRYHKSAVYWTKYSTQQHQTWFLGASAAGGNKCLFVAVHVHFLQLLTNHLRALINQHTFTPVSC